MWTDTFVRVFMNKDGCHEKNKRSCRLCKIESIHHQRKRFWIFMDVVRLTDVRCTAEKASGNYFFRQAFNYFLSPASSKISVNTTICSGVGEHFKLLVPLATLLSRS